MTPGGWISSTRDNAALFSGGLARPRQTNTPRPSAGHKPRRRKTKTITLTKTGISAHYGDPDRRLRITLPEDWGVWHCSKPGVGVVLIAPSWVTLPNVVADNHGGYWVAEWENIPTDRRGRGWTRVIAPAKMGGSALPPVQGGAYTWYDVMRAQRIAADYGPNLEYRRKMCPFWVEEEVDPVTGPLAPLGTEAQNGIAAILLGATPSD